ncbi:MAG: ABC transporter ATP-binding protein, partial [Eubacteriales bacterium]|nr:ABC transporter ATP-binding protein [Eubacteriales bacterium]
VSALDVSIQAQILNLLHDLQSQFDLTYLFITHDLGVVRYIATRVCVMFLGKICEISDTESLFAAPRHPYTHFLLASTPKPDPTKRKEKKDLLEGEVPSPIDPPPGCRFHKRCPFAQDVCTHTEPLLSGEGIRQVACHFPLN